MSARLVNIFADAVNIALDQNRFAVSLFAFDFFWSLQRGLQFRLKFAEFGRLLSFLCRPKFWIYFKGH